MSDRQAYRPLRVVPDEPKVIGHLCGPDGCFEVTDEEWRIAGDELAFVRRNLKPGEAIGWDEDGHFMAVPPDWTPA